MLPDIVEARVVEAHRVFVRFDDGTCGELDLGVLICFDGVFAALRDPDRFAELRVNPDTGTIEWPGGADIAPETLHDALTAQAGAAPDR